MKYIKLYENYKKGITFKEWLIDHPQDINTEIINCRRQSNLIDLDGIEQFKNLKKLFCDNNLLTKLPELPNSLKDLSCSFNQLNQLPELPHSLGTLSCFNNQLTSLPELPNSLESLSCNNNQLTSLPELPNSLEKLYCFNNKLTSLPELPNSLEKLYCFNNKLPYNNLNGYKEWYAKKYPERIKANKYNI
jgi:Leucine-rich repeat (LRR) protein